MAELAPLQTFLFEHGEVLGRSSLRFNFYLTESNSAAELAPLHAFFRNKKVQFCGGARSASYFYLIERQFCGGARSASNFYLTESNSAAEFAPLHSFLFEHEKPSGGVYFA